MLRIGLTGGIGSGKTTVAKVFEVLGIPVYYADAEARRIMNEDLDVRSKLIEIFGDMAYDNNELNRTFISSVVFGKKQLLDQLNAVVHPVSISHSNTWMQSQVSPYAIKEAALIFESGVNKSLDYVIGVSAPTNLRIQRTIIRDNSTVEKVLERIKNQMDEESKMKWCDHVILNDEMHLVVPQVLALHEQFLVRAG